MIHHRCKKHTLFHYYVYITYILLPYIEIYQYLPNTKIQRMIVVSDAISTDKSRISNSQQYKWKSMRNHATSWTVISIQRMSYAVVGCVYPPPARLRSRRCRCRCRCRFLYVGWVNGDSRHNGRPVIAKYTADL